MAETDNTSARLRVSALRRSWGTDLACFFRRGPIAVASLAVGVTLLLCALYAPLIAPHHPIDPGQLNLMNGFSALMPPNAFTGSLFHGHR